MKIRAAITAVGGYVPERILTNQDLEQMVETNDQWIRERTGIETRHILEAGKATSDMGTEAVRDLLSKTPYTPADIELIICATVSPDYVYPATANVIADKIGARRAWSFDMSVACAGFLYALRVGAQFIETGAHKRVLVVGADTMSIRVSYEDRNTCILFGDGAGAVLLEPDSECGFMDAEFEVDGSGCLLLQQRAGGSKHPSTVRNVRNGEHYIFQEGSTVFKSAVKGMADITELVMKRNGLTGEDISFLVPHQANKRIIDATASRANLPPEKVMVNIQRYGNTTAATLPLCLWDWEPQLKRGDNLMLAAFGGGFAWGAAWVKWAYDGASVARKQA